jgi:hypothetical protein
MEAQVLRSSLTALSPTHSQSTLQYKPDPYSRLAPSDFYRESPPIVLWSKSPFIAHSWRPKTSVRPTHPRVLRGTTSIVSSSNSSLSHIRRIFKAACIEVSFDCFDVKHMPRPHTLFSKLKSFDRSLICSPQRAVRGKDTKQGIASLLKCESVRSLKSSDLKAPVRSKRIQVVRRSLN